jgi:hypothetical protein
MNARIAAAALLLAVGAARAQVADHSAWYAKLGLQRSALSADSAARLDAFFARLEAEPVPDAVLERMEQAELASEGKAPGDPAADGAFWLSRTDGGWRLTDAGLKAVPAIVLKNTAGLDPKTAAAEPKPLDLSLPQSRIDAILAQNPGFDGSSSRDSGLPDAPLPSAALAASTPRSGLSPANKAIPESKFEKDAFWSTWWGYHAAFAADFTTTGMVIARGGYETDHLYTQFGNKNMAGVIGSAVVLHAVASLASVELHNQALKHHGFVRKAMEAGAIAINCYGIGVHSWGAGHNVGVLDNWNR